MKTFLQIKNKCSLKMNINGNMECSQMRKIISGMGGCLCRKENCPKLNTKKRC